MRHYEMLAILSPDLEDPKEEAGKIEEVVRGLGGNVTKTDVWGKKPLAYPIQKKSEGNYVLFNFDLEPAQTFELRRVLGLRPNVYRQMTLVVDA
ncbi:MAG: 30S ribosomal protein S6 [Fretibacterium sp.]|nr:30S ribosomal protein S6 [Fretibacterium sp.]